LSQRVDISAVIFRLTGTEVPAGQLIVLVAGMGIGLLVLRRLDRIALDREGRVAKAAADLLSCLTLLVCIVHEPGDALVAVPAATGVVAQLWLWRLDRRPERWVLCAALVALAVPFAHIHVVDSMLRHWVGAVPANTVDGVGLVMAWLLLVVFGSSIGRRAALVRRPVASGGSR